jgi:hypothetical protein
MKKLITIIVLLISINSFSQDAIGFSFALDNKLTFIEDDSGNKPFTFDGTFKFSMQGYQKKLGYLQIAAKYEFADLVGGEFHRYGAEVGYVFTYNNFGLMPFVGYGILKREGDYARRSWEAGATASLRVFRNIKVISSILWTERTDLRQQFRLNVQTGIQIDIKTGY